ncbi:MAG: C15orf41 family protein [Methanosarcinaceae archaeon]|nr:C15orf41 family protein [Methanosarcinaceae archaeon]
MSTIDNATYQEIYQSVDTIDDIDRTSRKFCQPVGVISSILNQKVVNNVKRSIHPIQNNGYKHLHNWKQGMSILELAHRCNIPATLMTSVLIKEMGFSKKYVLKHLDDIPDRRLAAEIQTALDTDHFFSPKAHDLQFRQGQMGEEIIGKWLVDKHIPYRTEEQLRELDMLKTPDFLLEEPLVVDGMSLQWIESKAVFADEREHTRYCRKQLHDYEEQYGNGMVIYWYGHIDGIAMEETLVRDHGFDIEFDYNIARDIVELLNFSLKW